MKARKLTLTFVALFLVAGMAADGMADVSAAAALFLRIAPGARAAGMGEAYVAIADDATATHWNPAGLGKYPLADAWMEASVPARFQPVTAVVPVSTGGDGSYRDYELWAVTPMGLVRHDKNNWHTSEMFETKTDETIHQVVRNYYATDSEEHLEEIVDRVARANNEKDYEWLVALKERIVTSLPEEYDAAERLLGDLDSALICYQLCRLNWDRLNEAESKLNDGLKDTLFTEMEMDRVAVAIERSRNRFINEELEIPYGALFGNEISAIASAGEALMVASESGVVLYGGRSWRPISLEEHLTTEHVTALHGVGNSILIGTDSGMAIFNGLTVDKLTVPEDDLPSAPVQAIGGYSLRNLYAIVNNELYRYDGMNWSNITSYQVVLDDSADRIARKFSLYGTDSEQQLYKEKFNALVTIRPVAPAEQIEAVPETEASPDTLQTEEAVAEQAVEAVVEPDLAEETTDDVAGELTPGTIIDLPFLAETRGEINSVYVDYQDRVWLGTEYGVFYFDGSRWQAPGYETRLVAEGETLDDLIRNQPLETEEARLSYLAQVRTVNDLGDGEPEAGTTIKLPVNPASAKILGIGGDRQRTYFATEVGLIEFDGQAWARSDMRGLGRTGTIGVITRNDNIWFASEDKVAYLARGRSEISLMHVNWAADFGLAENDMYYGFLSAVTQKKGWGTFGGNVTFFSYGKNYRTTTGSEVLETFESYDMAVTGCYGTSINDKLKGGIAAKIIISRLYGQGAGKELGDGNATGFAFDVGLLYLATPKLTWGVAVTNLGPAIQYSDYGQSDELPRNLAVGFAYKLLSSEYNRLLLTGEVNKMLVGLDDGFSEELNQSILSGGAEFSYANLLSARGGYYFDHEGQSKYFTFGVGLSLFDTFGFDFSYVPSQASSVFMANTLRVSLQLLL
ncbi:MAG: hypothetical protein DRP45_05680 [Candidatus Zixiibacteriota bacterium]|nr:MAG: hypothetical protein DRP45_05680 [candidate division Zixibacteria bacterium]